jgi:hypothetical protein
MTILELESTPQRGTIYPPKSMRSVQIAIICSKDQQCIPVDSLSFQLVDNVAYHIIHFGSHTMQSFDIALLVMRAGSNLFCHLATHTLSDWFPEEGDILCIYQLF